MAPLRSLVAAATTLLLLSTANAQFEILVPPSLEGSNVHKELQLQGACGGGVPDLASNPTTDFHVDGDAIALQLDGPQCNVLMGATLNERADGGWAQMFPIVQVTGGPGNFCQPAATAPREWIGKKAIIGIACKGPDAQRYQVGSDLFYLPYLGGGNPLLIVVCAMQKSVRPSSSSKASTRRSAPSAPTERGSVCATQTTRSSRA